MNTFKEIKQGIPDTIQVPQALEQLCNWIDDNGYPISGHFELQPDDGEMMRYWLGFDDVSDRFGIFGSGPDGSLYAIWVDDEGNQKIVHLGSEGGELYILADDFVDFLRLLAIGYDEIGFVNFSMTAQEWNMAIGVEENEGINPAFRNWVEKEFDVTIPERGDEIVDVDDLSFNDWIEAKLEEYGE